MYVLYWPWIQWLFVASATLMSGHYRTYITNGVGHLSSDLVVPLILCMTMYNIWGTSIVLQVPQDNANLAENG